MVKNQKIVDVAAAVIEKDGKFLIAKRKKGKHLENKWEFPGGKVEPEESPQACLARELKEESGISTEIGDFVAESVFDYGTVKVKLLGYRAKYIYGEFNLNDHDEIKWVSADEFDKFDLAEADVPLAKKVNKLI